MSTRKLLSLASVFLALALPARADMYPDASNAVLPVARTNLGLGTMATQTANAVAITGGTISGLTSLGVNGTISLPNSLTMTSAAITGGGDILTFGPLGTIGNANSLFTSSGAKALVLGDRVMIGAAAAVNPGNLPESPKDWLETLVPSSTQNSQLVSISTAGLGGLTAGSRCADKAGLTNCIGGNFYAYNNDTVNGSGGMAGYFEGLRTTGTTGGAFGFESDSVNLAASGVVISPPTANFFPQGITVDAWLACGAEIGTAPCSAAIAIANNGQPHEVGIVFQDRSLVTGRGAGGQGIAINMFHSQDIAWTNASNGLEAELYSDVTGLRAKGSLISQLYTGTGDNFVGASFNGGIQVALGTDGGGNNGYIGTVTNQGFYIKTNNGYHLFISPTGDLIYSGMLTVAAGTGKHFVCIDGTTKQFYEGTGASCN